VENALDEIDMVEDTVEAKPILICVLMTTNLIE
jgi:hypothetical protein